MVEVQLKGFPQWTEQEDLKYTIDEVGYASLGLRLLHDSTNPEATLAEAKLPTWEAADEVVRRLHKFEFTPGYPLQARVKPGQTRPGGKAASKGKPSSSTAAKGSDSGKGAGLAPEPQELNPNDPKTSVINCIGAGRIEGWFVNTRDNVLKRGWGHVQSYCFEGNLVYRPTNSKLLKDIDFKQKDACSFEVMQVKGQPEAVRLTTDEVAHLEDGKSAIIAPSDGLIKSGFGSPEMSNPDASALANDDSNPAPSLKSMRRREREEADGRCLFFGGFGREIPEDTLFKFAEQAGQVQKVKLMYNTSTWVSKGCAKVHYEHQEGADKALNEISGTVLNDRIVLVEPLGQSSNTNPNPQKKQRPSIAAQLNPVNTDDMPKQLPLSLFNANDTKEAKLQICFAAFEDLMQNHNAEVVGVSMILMIRKLVMEVNEIFGEDEESLQAWCQHLRGCQWFRDNQQVVKWQQSKKRVNISKISPNTPAYIEFQQNAHMQVEQRKLEQTIMGKQLFEVPEEEKALAPAKIPLWQKGGEKGGKGGGKRF